MKTDDEDRWGMIGEEKATQCKELRIEIRLGQQRISGLINKLLADSSVSNVNPNSNYIMPESQAHQLSLFFLLLSLCRSRCLRGSSGPANTCPTETTEGNGRLKRVGRTQDPQ